MTSSSPPSPASSVTAAPQTRLLSSSSSPPPSEFLQERRGKFRVPSDVSESRVVSSAAPPPSSPCGSSSSPGGGSRPDPLESRMCEDDRRRLLEGICAAAMDRTNQRAVGVLHVYTSHPTTVTFALSGWSRSPGDGLFSSLTSQNETGATRLFVKPRLSLSSPELLSELRDSRTRPLRRVPAHNGLTTVFSGRGRGGGQASGPTLSTRPANQKPSH